jgi:hypothetical protein
LPVFDHSDLRGPNELIDGLHSLLPCSFSLVTSTPPGIERIAAARYIVAQRMAAGFMAHTYPQPFAGL